MKNTINWFEIPVADMDRALAFYSSLFDTKLELMQGMPDVTMAMLPADEEGVGGAIVKHAQMKPSADGTHVYINGGDDLAPMLGRVEPAGGKVIMPKTSIGENGYMALITDTEGNTVGLHSMG